MHWDLVLAAIVCVAAIVALWTAMRRRPLSEHPSRSWKTPHSRQYDGQPPVYRPRLSHTERELQHAEDVANARALLARMDSALPELIGKQEGTSIPAVRRWLDDMPPIA